MAPLGWALTTPCHNTHAMTVMTTDPIFLAVPVPVSVVYELTLLLALPGCHYGADFMR